MVIWTALLPIIPSIVCPRFYFSKEFWLFLALLIKENSGQLFCPYVHLFSFCIACFDVLKVFNIYPFFKMLI